MPEHDIVDVRWFLAVIRHWLWLILSLLLVGLLGALAISARAAPAYSASVSLLIQPPATGTHDYQAVVTSERLAFTYSQMLLQAPVLEAVIEQLDLPETPDTLRDRMHVEPIANTQLIRLSVEHHDPALAAAVANALANAFVDEISALQMNRYTESLTSLESQIADLSTRLEEIQGEISGLGSPETTEAQAKLAHLQTIAAGYRNTHAVLIQNYEQMRLSAMQSAQSVIVAELAGTPEEPLARRRMYLIVGGVVGLLAGLGASFLFESLDDTIRSPGDVRRAADLGTLGVIGRLSRGECGATLATKPHSPHAEAFRVLCTNVCFGPREQLMRSLLVTSPSTGEGKSLMTANLAVTMAQAGFRVIAVDADTRRSSLGRFFNLRPRGDGLVRALKGESVDGLLQPTQIEGLSILTSGELLANPGQLFGSLRLHEFLEELGQLCDFVVIDSPPVLPVADTMLMASQVDGVLLVMHAGHTRRGPARQAVLSLRQMGANLIGAVINATPPRCGYYHYASYRARAGKAAELGRHGA